LMAVECYRGGASVAQETSNHFFTDFPNGLNSHVVNLGRSC